MYFYLSIYFPFDIRRNRGGGLGAAGKSGSKG